MLVTGFPAAAFATNCYVVAPGPGQDAIVVDPGIGVLDQLAGVLRQHRLRPVSVLLTHGHVDHVYSVTPVCGAHGISAVVHSEDRYRLGDPLASLDPSLVAMLEQQFGTRATWKEPDDIVEVAHGQRLELAGLQLDVVHAPGHTEGSVMFILPGTPGDDTAGDDHPAGDSDTAGTTVLTGDVLFAGSIGRTDLAGGDHQAMLRSLREQVLPLSDGAIVLPGHGPTTTIGRERATNPYLLDLS